MLNTIGVIIITVLIFLFLFYGSGLVIIFHSIFEISGSAKTKYDIASFMFKLSKGNLNLLHKTLDVILCGGKINTIESNTSFHKEYWLLGHKTAMEILKHQEYLNIDQFWFANDYESALKMMN